MARAVESGTPSAARFVRHEWRRLQEHDPAVLAAGHEARGGTGSTPFALELAEAMPVEVEQPAAAEAPATPEVGRRCAELRPARHESSA